MTETHDGAFAVACSSLQAFACTDGHVEARSCIDQEYVSDDLAADLARVEEQYASNEPPKPGVNNQSNPSTVHAELAFGHGWFERAVATWQRKSKWKIRTIDGRKVSTAPDTGSL